MHVNYSNFTQNHWPQCHLVMNLHKIQYATLLVCITMLAVTVVTIRFLGNPQQTGRNFVHPIVVERNRWINSLQPWDYMKLSNLEYFKFHMFNNVCVERSLFFITVVSKPSHFSQRMFIRSSWGNSSETGVKILFFFGVESTQENQKRLNEENLKFKDTIQGSYVDSYYNLTYTHAAILKYFIYHCSKVPYLLKVDDDVLVNVPAMTKFLSYASEQCSVKNVIYCHLPKVLDVLRYGVWKISSQEMPLTKYPQYCFGYFVLYHWNAAFKIYKEAQRGDFFKIEDAYFTGFLAERSGTSRKNMVNFLGKWEDIINYNYSYGTEGKINYLVSLPHLALNESEMIWNIVKDAPRKHKEIDIPADFCD